MLQHTMAFKQPLFQPQSPHLTMTTPVEEPNNDAEGAVEEEEENGVVPWAKSKAKQLL